MSNLTSVWFLLQIPPPHFHFCQVLLFYFTIKLLVITFLVTPTKLFVSHRVSVYTFFATLHEKKKHTNIKNSYKFMKSMKENKFQFPIENAMKTKKKEMWKTKLNDPLKFTLFHLHFTTFFTKEEEHSAIHFCQLLRKHSSKNNSPQQNLFNFHQVSRA